MCFCSANLSETYFTNRQDRCVQIDECAHLADFYAALVDAIAQCSFRLKRSGELSLDKRCEEHPFKGANAFDAVVMWCF